MGWAEVATRIKFYDGTQILTGTSNNTYQGVFSIGYLTDQSQRDKILEALHTLYETSTTARQFLDAITTGAGKDLLIATATDANQTAFNYVGDNLIALNWTNTNALHIFNANGDLVQSPLALTIIHEIIHLRLLPGSPPYYPSDFANQSETQLNQASADHRGQVLPIQDSIAVEMGLDDRTQPSYRGFLIANLDTRYSTLSQSTFTDANEIDIVRLGGNAVADNLNHSARTTLLRDLMFGFGGDDNIDTGAGDDYAFGGTGADDIVGGTGNDVLYGEADDDFLGGGDGDDFLDGGAGTNTMDGGVGSDTVSFRSLTTGLTVSYANGALTHNAANQTLTSIENVLLTDQIDTLTLNSAPGLIATLGGADIINILPVQQDGPEVFLLAPGEGGDSIRFSYALMASQPGVILIGPDAGDRLLFNGFNIFDFIGQAQHSSIQQGQSLWYNLGGGPEDNITRALLVSEQEGGAVSIQYWINEWSGANHTTYGMAVYVFGFESGDFGFTFTAPSPNGSVIRTSITDLATELGLTNVLAAIQSDHIWNWIGVGSWSQSAGATSGADTFAGVASGDVANGLDGDDTLNGAGGNDTLSGAAGADVLSGGSGVDSLNGGDGADTLSGGLANDSIQGGAGADTISWTVADGSDTIDGGADSDTFNASGSAAAEVGNATWNGTSVTALMGNSLSNVEAINLDLGSGVDWLTYNTSAAVVVNLQTNSASGFASVANVEKVLGGSGNDTLTGDGLDNRLDGAGGADTLNGGDGVDTVLGGDGADIIYASAGNDSLQGQNGNDTFHWTSTDGRDTFNGGADADTVNFAGSAVADVADANWNGSVITGLLDNALVDMETINLDLGGGADWLRYNSTSGVTVNLAAGTGTGFASITGVENLIGGTGNDSLTGDAGANKINGNDGADVIIGGGDADNLTGGLGSDTFVYAAGCGNDTINDFDAWAVGGQDFIDVSAFGINAGNFSARVAIIDTGPETVVRIDNTYFITLKNVSGDGDNVITDADFIFGP
jgi:Ca2+-binding RTX toxin-like protein